MSPNPGSAFLRRYYVSHLLLIVNPGSTSTKIAVYNGEEPMFEQTLRHSADELKDFSRIIDQLQFRKEIILSFLREQRFDVKELAAVVGRGGILKPIPGGTYLVNELMAADLSAAVRGEHASNLGGIIAREIAGEQGIPAFIVDPVAVDELAPEARVSGLPEIERRSIWHALNQKAVVRRAAAELGTTYAAANFIGVHLGGGISVAAHCRGQAIDVNNALDGDGPFSPERSGGLPVGDLVGLCFSGRYSQPEIRKKIAGRGGLVAYLGTNDGQEIQTRIAAGDQQAELIYKAMAYQVAKEIGAAAVVLKGDVAAIVISGGLAHDSTYLVPWLSERVAFIAPLIVYPGEFEMLALAQGGLRVLASEEQAKDYR